MEEILKNRQLRKEGKFIGIPLYKIFPKLSTFLPSFPKGAMWLISAATGIGKSKFARFLIRAIYSIYKDYEAKGKNPGFKPYFIIFLTEESRDELIIGLTSSLIKAKYNYSLSKLQILSMAKDQMSDEEFGYIRGVQPELKELLSFMHINDSIYNPYGIYKYCRYISREKGVHYYTKLQKSDGFITHTQYDGLGKEQKKLYKYAHYTPNDSEEFVIVVVDNLNNLSTERHHNGDLRLAITDWSREYAKKQLSMHWKWSVINVIQQGMDVEKKQFNTKGDSITEKLKPSIAGLGNSKECARDVEIFTGLFKPAKYGINKYEGYDTSKSGLGLNFISAIFEKNRIGTDTFELALYFDGATERFAPLGSPEEVKAAIEKAKEKAK